MSQTFLEPDVTSNGAGAGRWMVVIYNNDTNSMDEVVEILMIATNCDMHEAEIETWEAHHFGKAPVHFASKSDCEDAAAIISSIGIKTEISLEWEE